jgi:hypothetical protein
LSVHISRGFTILGVLLIASEAFAQAPSAPLTNASDEQAVEANPAADAQTSEPSPKNPESAEVTDPGQALAPAMRAYHAALEKRRLVASTPLSAQRLREELPKIEEKLAAGRRDEAINDLVYIVESPRFDAFRASDEGRAAVYFLGDALGRGGATVVARAYLASLLNAAPDEVWSRRAVRSLVDLGLESDRPEAFLEDLAKVPAAAPAEVRGDIAYLSGKSLERRGQSERALAEFTKVSEASRFWAQATYLSGVIEVERRNFKRGEQLFCKVADPKLTPKRSALFGGSDFFRVRDLARLGLGRVAHEQYRFDDARYYYYLVPRDSEELPQALYETATTRYEAKDYAGAREFLDELKRTNLEHVYTDEAYILDAYVDLAECRFDRADGKLQAFLKRYEPVRDASRKLLKDGASMQRLVEAVRTARDPAGAGLGIPVATARTLGALLRIDAGYSKVARQRAQLEHQRSGLRGTLRELDEAARRLSTPNSVKPNQASLNTASDADKLERIDGQIAELKRLLREASEKGRAGKAQELEALERELEALELRAKALHVSGAAPEKPASGAPQDLPALIAADRERALLLQARAEKLVLETEQRQVTLAKEAFERLERRLSRLLSRARLGRIETVLGRKRALELEIEALSQGLLPHTIVDSLDAARYLQDNEEFWPYQGEDWEDEYVGGEGVR